MGRGKMAVLNKTGGYPSLHSGQYHSITPLQGWSVSQPCPLCDHQQAYCPVPCFLQQQAQLRSPLAHSALGAHCRLCVLRVLPLVHHDHILTPWQGNPVGRILVEWVGHHPAVIFPCGRHLCSPFHLVHPCRHHRDHVHLLRQHVCNRPVGGVRHCFGMQVGSNQSCRGGTALIVHDWLNCHSRHRHANPLCPCLHHLLCPHDHPGNRRDLFHGNVMGTYDLVLHQTLHPGGHSPPAHQCSSSFQELQQLGHWTFALRPAVQQCQTHLVTNQQVWTLQSQQDLAHLGDHHCHVHLRARSGLVHRLCRSGVLVHGCHIRLCLCDGVGDSQAGDDGDDHDPGGGGRDILHGVVPGDDADDDDDQHHEEEEGTTATSSSTNNRRLDGQHHHQEEKEEGATTGSSAVSSSSSSIFSLSSLPSLTPPHNAPPNGGGGRGGGATDGSLDAAAGGVTLSSLQHLTGCVQKKSGTMVSWSGWLRTDIIDALNLRRHTLPLDLIADHSQREGMQAFRQLEWWYDRCNMLKEGNAHLHIGAGGGFYTPENDEKALGCLWNKPFQPEMWFRMLSSTNPMYSEPFALIEEDANSQKFSRFNPEQFVNAHHWITENPSDPLSAPPNPVDHHHHETFMKRQFSLLLQAPTQQLVSLEYCAMEGCTICRYWWTLVLSHCRYHAAEYTLHKIDTQCPPHLQKSKAQWHHLLCSVWNKKVMMYAANVFLTEHCKHGHTKMTVVNPQLYGGELGEEDFGVIERLQNNEWSKHKDDFTQATDKRGFIEAAVLRALVLPQMGDE
eukprot:TRINITY_DN66127_c3_g2_i7.p1 TRINITY_DN66127_c3_g2~~TRINITY_DN66127_c3_g2_i7.p1  ORF type:complete len:784 (-),score=88.64 TRINITY_DN66127_c3_g2_i7:375-2726(-)